MTPLPHQIAGARFLASRSRALLADAPRVGKTGATILAADDILARRVLTVTTASGRAVWERAWRDWSAYDIPLASLYGTDVEKALKADRVVVGWGQLPKLAPRLAAEKWDLIILDESHYAKSWGAQRTLAAYGAPGATDALVDSAAVVWCLTGTPIPNAANDLHPMLAKLAPERLDDDTRDYADFLNRYCITRPKRLSRWTKIDVVVGSRNLDELHGRMEGFWLRRTQADVGITEPIYEVLPIRISDAERKRVEASVENAEDILDAAETGETKSLDLHLGALRRLTGAIKARGVVQVVKDDFAGGLDKIVVMAWHRETLDHLQDALSSVGCVRIDGSTTPANRDKAQREFARDGGPRVFLGQIIACGEAIDLSAAADLIFAESSWVPKDMAQAALRITNVNQTRQPRVRVAALAGSIDEALQTVLTRKVKDIKEILSRD